MPKASGIFTKIDCELSGDLTYDKWLLWYEILYRESMKGRLGEHDPETIGLYQVMLKSQYETLEKSVWIVENFFFLSGNLRQLISELAEYTVPAQTIVCFVKLLEELCQVDPNVDLSSLQIGTISSRVTEAYKRAYPNPTEHLNAAILRYTGFERNDPLICNNAAKILSILYGEETFVSATEEWCQNTTTKDLDVFAAIIDKWDELEPYPIDWSVHLVTSQTINSPDYTS